MRELDIVVEQYCRDVNTAQAKGFHFDHEAFKNEARVFALSKMSDARIFAEVMLIYNMSVHCSDDDPYAFLFLMDRLYDSKQPTLRLDVLGSLLNEFGSVL